MSALKSSSEVLLMALFTSAGQAENAVESLWRRGLEPERLSLLAREPGRRVGEASLPSTDWHHQKAVSPHLWFRFPQAAVLRLPPLGVVVALGPIAAELADGPAARGRHPRVASGLRRLGLASAETPRFERALQEGLVLLVARVARAEAHEWDARLQVGGAAFLSAHLRLEPWPRETRRPRRHGGHQRAHDRTSVSRAEQPLRRRHPRDPAGPE